MPENETSEERKLRERAEWIQGLRDLADLFESKPELPKPYRLYINEWVSSSEGKDEVKAQMASIAKALSPCKKDYSSDSFSIERNIGPHYLSYNTAREKFPHTKKM